MNYHNNRIFLAKNIVLLLLLTFNYSFLLHPSKKMSGNIKNTFWSEIQPFYSKEGNDIWPGKWTALSSFQVGLSVPMDKIITTVFLYAKIKKSPQAVWYDLLKWML